MHCFTSGTQNSFDLFSGMSLERKVKIELEDIDGVLWADIKRSGSVIDVNVVVNELEFGSFEKITRHEMYLFEKYPDLRFDFRVTPVAALDNAA